MKTHLVFLHAFLGILAIALPITTGQAASCDACSQCGIPRTEDTLVCGCVENVPGQLDCSSVLGFFGETLSVAISVETVTELRALGFDLEFPPDLLQYVSTSPGSLLQDFDFFGGSLHPDNGLVRVGAFETGQGNVPPGASGDLAIINFEIIGIGCDTFCLVNLVDDIGEYGACTISPPTGVDDPMVLSTWGQVKSQYR